MMNAQYAINSAWRIGCSVFILWEDIVEIKPNMILIFIAALMMLE
jgi:plastin-1